MRKMRKALSLALVASMAMGSLTLTGCGKKETIKLWVADATVEFTKTQIEAFKASNPDFAKFEYVVEAVGEGDAAGNMITDVAGGADLYGFAQDQLSRLVAAGALNPVTTNADFVKTSNDAGAVSAATVGNTIYAYPMTSDNGYFLYYDKSVVKDASTLEGIIADVEAAGKTFYFEVNSGWYQTAFFFGAGAELTYETDNDGNFTVCNASYASDAGLVALKEMIDLASSSAFVNGSSIGAADAEKVAAIVDGTWDASAAKDLFKDNYACAKLPTFTGADGKTYQMSGFGGFKLLGVKPQTNAKKLEACNALAKFLTDEACQLARYDAVLWGPSNMNAQKSDKVKADEALSALAEQLAFTIPQGQYPGDYWTDATSLGDDIIAGTYTGLSDADLLAVLKDFQGKAEAQVK